MADEDVAREAKERGVTRATVSMERAAKIEKPVIFAIGNAPTALIQLYGMIEAVSYTHLVDRAPDRMAGSKAAWRDRRRGAK